MDIVRLSVPGSLPYRDVVLRAVASACRRVRPPTQEQEISREPAAAEFESKVLSAVTEAFNNVAIHAYRGRPAGPVDVELEPTDYGVTIRLMDMGHGYDPTAKPPPDLHSLPESNMGLFIMRSCMDYVSYERGNPPAAPNVLTLSKRYPGA